MTEWVTNGWFLGAAAAFLAAELTALATKRPTVSQHLWLLQQRYGWKVRGPLLAAWLLLGSHLLLHFPR